MPVITCIEDLRQLARKRVPRAFYDYADSGSYTESTYRANADDLAAIRLRQRVAVDVDNRSTRGTLLGQEVSMPVAIAPTGLAGMQWADGEILGAQAAEQFGIPFTLSTMSICSIEDVAAATTKPFWFQLYVMRDRGFIAELIQRARAARCSALVLTLDLQILGQRHKDLKNGMTVPLRPTLANLLDVASKPAWALRMLGARRKTFGNLAGHVKDADGINSLARWTARQFDPTLSWKDVAWIRQQWDGKLILKGILDPEDARSAASCGADAIVASNHGGRQLDGALSSIAALPAIVEAVGDRTEVLFDGGVRSGQDVLKALALGARGAMIGRAFLYGLGAMGRPGVDAALGIIQRELDVSMALTGTRTVEEIGPGILIRP
ncbi:alpha-hydroxy acid oxidase [Pigmentiphaga sp.]|uniref:alpha-hydroxy acid oxidase n=1 Tax=Pigmentiphaga sp. TaxID=1977564 RepID=UPI00128C37DC|nr:alpha-hydroxy acid oxidase [Pigmentiphaga sp.]MPS27967.1 alpha-hydroxy-acid oxidizing protein [Alcaligenaceae bacterium SAGV5]MPS51067.1 alpha-hydroxy-acid oxidizing protein [Alcaligenaceae bacterium SAGV3]MPT59405.1 alpha-hydroxy-acid oxidizing protein [Alcaligenaceae bacterium]